MYRRQGMCRRLLAGIESVCYLDFVMLCQLIYNLNILHVLWIFHKLVVPLLIMLQALRFVFSIIIYLLSIFHQIHGFWLLFFYLKCHEYIMHDYFLMQQILSSFPMTFRLNLQFATVYLLTHRCFKVRMCTYFTSFHSIGLVSGFCKLEFQSFSFKQPFWTPLNKYKPS